MANNLPYPWNVITGFISVSELTNPGSYYTETELVALLRVDRTWFDLNPESPRRGAAQRRATNVFKLNQKGIASIKRAIPSFNERDYEWDFLSAGGFEDERRKIQADIAHLQKMLQISSQRF